MRIPPFIYGAASAALSLVLLAPAGALAATGTGENTPLSLPADGGAKKVTSASGGGSLVRTKEERGQGTSLETTAVVALGPNRSLHLVRAGRELVLVGVAEHGVTPIRTYSEDEAIDLGLIGEDDDDLDGTPHAATSRAGAVRWLDRLKDRTVRL